jgi:cytochrome c oxidase subunit 4
MGETQENPENPAEHAEGHPSELEYVKVAVFLAAVTAAEVAIYYITGLRRVLPYALLVLSVVKFSMVVLWFMHLKFDSRMFRRLFLVGIVLALGVYAIVLGTFGIFFVSR